MFSILPRLPNKLAAGRARQRRGTAGADAPSGLADSLGAIFGKVTSGSSLKRIVLLTSPFFTPAVTWQEGAQHPLEQAPPTLLRYQSHRLKTHCHARESVHPVGAHGRHFAEYWIPAFAGMTVTTGHRRSSASISRCADAIQGGSTAINSGASPAINAWASD